MKELKPLLIFLSIALKFVEPYRSASRVQLWHENELNDLNEKISGMNTAKEKNEDVNIKSSTTQPSLPASSTHTSRSEMEPENFKFVPSAAIGSSHFSSTSTPDDSVPTSTKIDGSITWKITLLLCLTVLWVFTGIYFFLKCFRRKKRMSTRPEHVVMLPNMPTVENEGYFFLFERIEQLKYDRSFEIPRESVELGDFIGEGQFGEVYEGNLSWECRRRSQLLKVFPGNKVPIAIKKDVQLRKKILDEELKLMCYVGYHPYVVALVGAVTDNCHEGTLILMEKCSTHNLHRFLKTRKSNFIPQYEKGVDKYGYLTSKSSPKNSLMEYKKLDNTANWKPDLSKDITTAHLLSFAMQIAQGMDYLSSITCVHRDLAARNILLTQDGTIKIADFGLAKRIGYNEYYRLQSNCELPYRWMSVESLREGKFSIQSDIWSYGILLYEIFTLDGIPYPRIKNNTSLIDEILKGTQNEQPNYCPDSIYHHMTMCWSFEAEKRPSFCKSAELMKSHLAMASEDVLHKVTKEFELESERQKCLSILRSEVQTRDYLSVPQFYVIGCSACQWRKHMSCYHQCKPWRVGENISSIDGRAYLIFADMCYKYVNETLSYKDDAIQEPP